MNGKAKQPEHLPNALTELGKEIDWVSGSDATRYRVDPRDRFTGKDIVVFKPVSTKQVADIVFSCADNGIGIIPLGGGTGVVAGQLALDDSQIIAVSMERMNTIREVSQEDGVIIAEAGCVLADLQTAALEHGSLFPLSMASQGSARLGGILATNCGGIQVVRYGNARDLCLGIEAVLPDGSVLSDLSPVRKDNTGYDLRHLLIGSEGTLGIITAATMMIKPPDEIRITVFCGVASPNQAVTLLRSLQTASGTEVSCFELMCDYGIDLLAIHFPQESFPLRSRYEWYCLIDIGCAQQSRTLIEDALAGALERSVIADAVLANSASQSDALWRLREKIPEANRLSGAICSSDTAVPVSQIDAFIGSAYSRVRNINDTLKINCYGHIGDGNIHFNIFPPEGKTKSEIENIEPKLIEHIRMAINESTVEFSGSISAEHGIGRLKRQDLLHYADPAKLKIMRAIKRAIDPKGIMNPGALMDP